MIQESAEKSRKIIQLHRAPTENALSFTERAHCVHLRLKAAVLLNEDSKNRGIEELIQMLDNQLLKDKYFEFNAKFCPLVQP